MAEPFGGLDTPPELKSVRGIRAWHTADTKNRLVGMVAPWDHDDIHIAKCLCCDHGAASDPECSCGYYAYYSFDRKKMSIPYPVAVIGVIEGFGNVTIGTEGFRCEKARILALSLYKSEPNTNQENMTTWSRMRFRRVMIDLEHGLEANEWFSGYLLNLIPDDRYGSWDYVGVPVFNTVSDMLLEFPTTQLKDVT